MDEAKGLCLSENAVTCCPNTAHDDPCDLLGIISVGKSHSVDLPLLPLLCNGDAVFSCLVVCMSCSPMRIHPSWWQLDKESHRFGIWVSPDWANSSALKSGYMCHIGYMFIKSGCRESKVLAFRICQFWNLSNKQVKWNHGCRLEQCICCFPSHMRNSRTNSIPASNGCFVPLNALTEWALWDHSLYVMEFCSLAHDGMGHSIAVLRNTSAPLFQRIPWWLCFRHSLMEIWLLPLTSDHSSSFLLYCKFISISAEYTVSKVLPRMHCGLTFVIDLMDAVFLARHHWSSWNLWLLVLKKIENAWIHF